MACWLAFSINTRISLLPNKETLCKNVNECSSYYLFPEVHNFSSSFILGKHCANSPNRSCPLRVIFSPNRSCNCSYSHNTKSEIRLRRSGPNSYDIEEPNCWILILSQLIISDDLKRGKYCSKAENYSSNLSSDNNNNRHTFHPWRSHRWIVCIQDSC